MTDSQVTRPNEPSVPVTPTRTWPMWLALGLSVVAVAVVGLQSWQNSKQQQAVLTRYADMQALANQAKRNADDTLTLVQGLQARLVVTEERLADVALQRGQLEELIRSVSRSRDDGLIQDIDSALRLALQQAQLTGSVQPLITVLQATSQRIAKSSQPRLNAVQRAIERDLAYIHQAALLDVPGLADRLDEMMVAMDGLRPLSHAVNAVPADAVAMPTPPAFGLSSAQGWQALTAQSWAWLSHVWSEVLHSAKDLIRISDIERPEAMLISPEQVFMLQQNLKMQLLNARLGLLSRHLSVAQADIQQVQMYVSRYFDPQDPKTARLIKGLAQASDEIGRAESPKIDDTLRALSAAAEGL